MRPIVILASFPRSGNTFVRQILKEAFDCESFTPYPDEWQTEHLGGHVSRAGFIGVPVVFLKTHCIHSRAENIWHIVRDGRDAYSSWNAMKKRVDKLSAWGEFVLDVDKRATVTSRYEDLIVDPIGVVSDAIDRMHLSHLLPLKSRALTAFDDLHLLNPAFFRRGVVGNYRNEMDDVEEFERLNREALERFGYQLDGVAQ